MKKEDKIILRKRRILAAKCFALAALVFVFFLIWILLIKTVDVQAIGPDGTKVGFATLNGAFHDSFSWHKTFYNIKLKHIHWY